MSLSGAGNQLSNTIKGLDLAGQSHIDKGQPKPTGSAFGRTVSIPTAKPRRQAPPPPAPSSQTSTANHSKPLSEFKVSTHPVTTPKVKPRSGSVGSALTIPPVPGKNQPPKPLNSFSSVSSQGIQSMEKAQAKESEGSLASKTESVKGGHRQLEPVATSKGSAYGRLKRFIKKQAWKTIPREVLQTVDKPLRTKLQARNEKITRLNELKRQTQEWKKFEHDFSKELKLLNADKPPEKGTFKIPGSEEEIIFTKDQSMLVKQKKLKEFQETFEASRGFGHYQEASFASANATEERAALKESLAQDVKQLEFEIEKQFRRKEDQYHAQINDKTNARHQQVDIRKGELSNHYQELIKTYQEQVTNLVEDLSNLGKRRNYLQELGIPQQEGRVKSLEQKLRQQESSLKSRYKKLPRKQRQAQSFAAFAAPELKEVAQQLQAEKRQLTRLHQEFNSYKDNKSALQTELKTARKTLARIQKSSALKETYKDINRETRIKDRQDMEAHKAISDIVKDDKNAVHQSIKGR